MFVRATAFAALFAGAVIAAPTASEARCNSCQPVQPACNTCGTYTSQWNYGSWQQAPVASNQGYGCGAEWAPAHVPAGGGYAGDIYRTSERMTVSPYAYSSSYSYVPQTQASYAPAATWGTSQFDYTASYAQPNYSYNGSYGPATYSSSYSGTAGSAAFDTGQNWNTSASWGGSYGSNTSSFQGNANFGGSNLSFGAGL